MLSFTRSDLFIYLISFFALGLLIIGVLYPEAKNTIFDIPWTWFFIWFGLCLILYFKFYDSHSIGLIVGFFTILLVSIIYNYIGLAFGYFETISADHLLKNFSTLFITSSVAFLLLIRIDRDSLPRILDSFALAMCFALLLFRLIELDFSREGFFIGLGPLTFIKYVSVGFLARLFFIKKWSILSTALYAFAFIIAASKGPLLFVILVVFLKLILEKELNLKTLLPFILFVAFISFGTDRISTFFIDIQNLISSDELVSISNEDIAFEAVSSTIIRIFAYTSTALIIVENIFFGIGAGQWVDVINLPSLEYPHNSILEIWSEFGMLPIILFLYIALKVFNCTLKGNSYGYIALFAFLTSMTSGTIADLRFFAFYALITFYISSVDKYEQKKLI